jgi:oligopeptide/dipeptide ABC transporter ATP-binding protein
MILSAAQSQQQRSDMGLLLHVQDLKVSFRKGRRKFLPVIDTANLTLHPNQALGLVGESGSGKSMLCRALIGTLDRHQAVIEAGSIRYQGKELVNLPKNAWQQIRGREIGYVPQSSLAGLNPVLNIETQLTEAILAAKPVSKVEATKTSLELLEKVRIPRAQSLLKAYSYQLSGGMRQRVMIAAALAQEPRLLIADEPTTALDVTIQHEILMLLSSLRRELGMALILVSHDLAVIEMVCDTMMVMYAGVSVEAGSIADITAHPRHPYTRSLRESRVDNAIPGEDLETIPGEPMSVGNWAPGCRFAPRCRLADDACRQGVHPPLQKVGDQASACIHIDRMEQP